jgi:hypothetical protein
VKPSELSQFASSLHHPLYWAGGRVGATYGLTRTGRDGFQVHYAPTKRGALTVGTYAMADPVAAVRRSARAPGTRLVKLRRGGVAAVGVPTDVHFAYPGQRVQVEVFDPSGRALALVTTGRIVPVPVARPR